MKVKQERANGRFEGLRRLAFNKWSLTIAVMLLMLSVYVTVEQPGVADDVLYVTDTLPYEVQKVSGEGSLTLVDDDKGDEKDEPAAGDNTAVLEGDERYSINGDSDFYINYRLEREKVRARQLELLQGVIDDENTTDEVRKSAQEQVLAEAEATSSELMLESILAARYGGECAVFMQNGKVNVVLNADEGMSDSEAEKIAALVDNYTDVGLENVVVVLKEKVGRPAD